MSECRGQSQIDWIIGFIAFFIFLTGVVTIPASPLFLAGYYDNSLEMDAQTTAEVIVYDTLRNEDGEITHEEINHFTNGSKQVNEYITSSQELNANITIVNADNPAGSAAEVGNEPVPLRNSDNTIGDPIPSRPDLTNASVTVSVDERPVRVNVVVWR